MGGIELPAQDFGHEPQYGGKIIAVAVSRELNDIPAVTAADAARMLSVSSARVSQLINAKLLDSWKDGTKRMVSKASIEHDSPTHQRQGAQKRSLCCIRRGYCALLFHTMFSAWYKQVQYQNAIPTIVSNYERIFAFSAANSSSVSTPLSRSAASLSSLAATSPLSTSVSIVCETCGYCSSSFDRASTISAIFFAFLPPFNTFALTLDDELTVTPDPPSTGTTEILIFSPQDRNYGKAT